MSFLDSSIDTDLRSRPSRGGVALSGSARLYATSLKRVLDVSVVILTLPFTIPLIALMALLVACDGGNPFYSQPRLGRGGRTFRLWKLRTMVPNADKELLRHLAADSDARAEWAVKQKLSYDPRVTLIGRVLRKSSMDELPQLLNVLTGDMSLVGPRPMMVDQKPLYPGRAYFALRPGITGNWQVSDRNETSFAERAKFDTNYYKAISFSEDIRLLAATVRVILRGTGC